MDTDFHGIIINISQKNYSVLHSLEIIGRKVVLLHIVSLLKVRVPSESLDATIKRLQDNMRKNCLPFAHSFYFHFYNDDELIVVFKNKLFRVKPEPLQFGEIVEYGKMVGIPEKQLDFCPFRFKDETF
jgi:hypothetical protein